MKFCSDSRMRFLISIVCLVLLFVRTSHGASLPGRLRRDVVDTVKSVYETVAKGTKAVVNDLIGNEHVAVESYRQAADASSRVGPAFKGIFVNPYKPEAITGPPPQPNPTWNNA